MVQANIHEIFTEEQIARFTAEGRWPPPEGITFIKEHAPDPRAVQELAFAMFASFVHEYKLDEAATVWEIFDLSSYDGTVVLGVPLPFPTDGSA